MASFRQSAIPAFGGFGGVQDDIWGALNHFDRRSSSPLDPLIYTLILLHTVLRTYNNNKYSVHKLHMDMYITLEYSCDIWYIMCCCSPPNEIGKQNKHYYLLYRFLCHSHRSKCKCMYMYITNNMYLHIKSIYVEKSESNNTYKYISTHVTYICILQLEK